MTNDISDDASRYSDPGIGYLLLMTPPWTRTAVSLHPLLSEAAIGARRRFVRQETGTYVAAVHLAQRGHE